ncbi:MAG: hypothetical protein OYL97_08490 [Candidatus Poribacteria bacterium]|nr:hypothetical protein [Candidatus Poribacteria bacterium]
MPIPAALVALGKWALANPQWSIPIGTTLISGLNRWINPDRARELQMDVLDSQTQFRDMLARQAFGNFTAAERQQIAGAAEPQVNQVAANVARRGLGGSGAGAQIISQAQQRPFEVAQQQALQALPGANQSLLQGSQLLMDDGSFFDDLGTIARDLALATEAGDDTSELVEAIKMLYEAMGSPELSTTSAGVPNYEGTEWLNRGWQRHIGG